MSHMTLVGTLAFIFIFFFTGCSTPLITMRHPDGRVAQCGDSYSWGYTGNLSSQDRDRGCVYDYQRQGYERSPR